MSIHSMKHIGNLEFKQAVFIKRIQMLQHVFRFGNQIKIHVSIIRFLTKVFYITTFELQFFQNLLRFCKR